MSESLAKAYESKDVERRWYAFWEEKGYVTHSVVNGTFIYRAVETPEKAAAGAVHEIVHRYCGGSLERVLMALVDAGFASPDQLKELAGKLKRRSR